MTFHSGKSPSFSEILNEDWHVPKEPAPGPAMSEPEDSLKLSLQAGKALGTPSRKPSRPLIPAIFKSRDNQGNSVRISALGKSHASPENVAWETQIDKMPGT